MPILNKTITVSNFSDSWLNKRAYFISECGNISIYYCTFIKCYSLNENGGSLLVTQDLSVIIYGTQFIDSHTSMNHGACCIVKQFNENDDISIIKCSILLFFRLLSRNKQRKIFWIGTFLCIKKNRTVYKLTSNPLCYQIKRYSKRYCLVYDNNIVYMLTTDCLIE